MRSHTDPVARNLLLDLKKRTNIPVAPGFGISDREQIREWADAGADAVIVGSALVRKIEECLNEPDTLVPGITEFVQSLIKE